MTAAIVWPARLAWLLGVMGVALAAAGVWLGLASGGVLPVALEAGPGPMFFLAASTFVIAGAVLAVKRPGNPVGWIQLAMGLIAQVSGVAGVYRVAVFAEAGTVSSPWAALMWDVLWIPGIALVPLLFVLFPDGRLPSRRWWPVPTLTIIAATLLLVSVAFRPGLFTNTPIANPVGIGALAGISPVLELVGSLAMAVSMGASLAALVVRYRRAKRVERYQLRWFVAAAAAIGIAWGVANLLESYGTDAPVLAVVRLGPLLALPIATAFAVLRYRLYDIDLVISKGLLYTGLAGFVAGVYLVVVVGVGTVIGARDGVSVPLTVIATALAAVALQPMRQRLSRLANRAVYGRRANPYEVLASFTQQMADAYPTGEAPGAMAEVIGDALRLARCDVWLRVRDELVLAARWPLHEALPPTPVRADDEPLTLPGAERTYTVRNEGRLLGAIGISSAPGETVTAAQDQLLADLASAAWLVFDNAQLVRELRNSQQRLVAAQDGQRRRIERNLHDGAQQRLLELALTLRLAHQQVDAGGDSPAAGTLAAAELQLRAALAELRDLARGIHPAILTERGLVAAIESLAERAPFPVTVTADEIGRLADAVEATAYFVTAEALANVIKHAGASRATVIVTAAASRLHLTVVDDGCGGADVSAPGLSGLADRVTALDGYIRIDSPRGAGTRIAVELPCA